MNQASTYFFGKLPAYADYVAYQAEGPAATVFERWVRGGMHLVGHSLLWDEVVSKSARVSFCLPTCWPTIGGPALGKYGPCWSGNTHSGLALMHEMKPGDVPQLLAQYPGYFDGIEQSLEGGILHIKPDALLTLIPKLRSPINNDMEYECVYFESDGGCFCETYVWSRRTSFVEVCVPISD